jgi:hypothetical protein
MKDRLDECITDNIDRVDEEDASDDPRKVNDK